jgi:hypothetical protein
MGLVEKSELDKRTNEYALTNEGEQAILNQLSWMFSKFITGEDGAEKIESLAAEHA